MARQRRFPNKLSLGITNTKPVGHYRCKHQHWNPHPGQQPRIATQIYQAEVFAGGNKHINLAMWPAILLRCMHPVCVAPAIGLGPGEQVLPLADLSTFVPTSGVGGPWFSNAWPREQVKQAADLVRHSASRFLKQQLRKEVRAGSRSIFFSEAAAPEDSSARDALNLRRKVKDRRHFFSRRRGH